MSRLTDAKELLKKINMTINVKDGEYRVNFAEGTEASAYYTHDIMDAVCTAFSMYHKERWYEYCEASKGRTS